MFVAVTRAEKGLFLSDAEGRSIDGSFRYPSRFVFDIDRQYLDYTSELNESLKAEAERYISSVQNRLTAQTQEPALQHLVLHSIWVLQLRLSAASFSLLQAKININYLEKMAKENL